jgi:hypothetical protein
VGHERVVKGRAGGTERDCRGILGIRLGLPSDQQFGDFLSLAACDKELCYAQAGRTAAQDAVPCICSSV